MAKKWTKGIVGLAAIGAAAAGILYMKNKRIMKIWKMNLLMILKISTSIWMMI